MDADERSNGSVPEAKKAKQNDVHHAEEMAALASTGLRTSDLRDPAPLFDDVVSLSLLPAGRERQITVEQARAGTQGWSKGWSCSSSMQESERRHVSVGVCGPAAFDQAPASLLAQDGVQNH